MTKRDLGICRGSASHPAGSSMKSSLYQSEEGEEESVLGHNDFVSLFLERSKKRPPAAAAAAAGSSAMSEKPTVTNDISSFRLTGSSSHNPSSYSHTAFSGLTTTHNFVGTSSAFSSSLAGTKRSHYSDFGASSFHDELHGVKKTCRYDSKDDAALIVSRSLMGVKLEACKLRPHPECALFVAWNGAIVLCYEGFPLSFQAAKERVERCVPNLKPEDFGSKWAKTTLGAFQDDEQELSLEELKRLKDICLEFSARIASIKGDIPIKTLSPVYYKCRSLEKLQHPRMDVDLDPKTMQYGVTNAAVPPQDKAVVDEIVNEWDDLESYLPKINAKGGSIKSYREECAGEAFVAFLGTVTGGTSMPYMLRRKISEFRETVDKEFPGLYSWIDEDALHCTLRSLDRDNRSS